MLHKLHKERLKPETGPLVRARLIDISATGLGARTSVDVDATLVSTPRATVLMVLPTQRDPVSLPGILRSRVLAGPHVRYGISFDFAASDHAEGPQNAIIDYVMHRQREALRQSKD